MRLSGDESPTLLPGTEEFGVFLVCGDQDTFRECRALPYDFVANGEIGVVCVDVPALSASNGPSFIPCLFCATVPALWSTTPSSKLL